MSLAYVIDKKANQFWICTARYNFQDLTANNGDGVQLPSDIGRPSLTETSDVRAVTGSAAISDFLPFFWFIERRTACWIMRADEAALTAPKLARQRFRFTGTVETGIYAR